MPEKYVRIVQECYKNVTTRVRSTVGYAGDTVLVKEGRRQPERKLEEWRIALESRGMKISRSKTEYFTTDTGGDQQATIRLNGERTLNVLLLNYLQILKIVKALKYFRSMVSMRQKR